MINKNTIAKELKYEVDVYAFKELVSTNTTAMLLTDSKPEKPALVVADSQKEGRGRRGRSFYSPANDGIYMSILFKPKFDMTNAVLVTTAAAVATAKAIKTFTGKEIQIKWVNDLFFDNKKICGILTEGATDAQTGKIEYVVCGIGINLYVDKENIPEDLKEVVGALYENNSSALSDNEKEAFIALITSEFLELMEKLADDDISFLEYYKDMSMLLGREINIYETLVVEGAQCIPARAIDISDDGGLVVQLEDGTITTLTTGEVSVRLR